MQLRDLNSTERQVLLWLLGTLTQVDGRIDEAEVEELRFVGSSLEVDLVPAMDEALDAYSDQEEALAAARFVREEARPTIRQLLQDLATGDGSIASEEQALLAALERTWAS